MKAVVPEVLRRGLVRPDPNAPPHEQFHAFFIPDEGEVDEQEKYRQEMMRRGSSLSALSQVEQEYAFNLRRVEAYSKEYERIRLLKRTKAKHLANDRQIAIDREPAIKLQLEEALRDIGELDLAMKVAINPDRRAKLKAAKKANDLPDDRLCKCKDIVEETPEGTFLRSRFIVVKRVFSKKHQAAGGDEHLHQFPYLIRCVKCPFRNVTHQLPELLLHERRVQGKHAPEALARDATLRTHDRHVFREVKPRG